MIQPKLVCFKAMVQSLKSLAENQMLLLTEQVEDLKKLYSKRPSREEDVETIQRQCKSIEDHQEAYRKLYEDMQYYKLELVNKEAAYTKLFGKQTLKRGMSGL